MVSDTEVETSMFHIIHGVFKSEWSNGGVYSDTCSDTTPLAWLLSAASGVAWDGGSTAEVGSVVGKDRASEWGHDWESYFCCSCDVVSR